MSRQKKMLPLILWSFGTTKNQTKKQTVWSTLCRKESSHKICWKNMQWQWAPIFRVSGFTGWPLALKFHLAISVSKPCGRVWKAQHMEVVQNRCNQRMWWESHQRYLRLSRYCPNKTQFPPHKKICYRFLGEHEVCSSSQNVWLLRYFSHICLHPCRMHKGSHRCENIHTWRDRLTKMQRGVLRK